MSNSNSKNNLPVKKAAGAALVALSGFVPQPFLQTGNLVNDAHAATTKFNVTGSLISGIQLKSAKSIKFGKLAPSAANGKATLKTAGTKVTVSKGVYASGAAAGLLSFKAVSTTPNIDLTLSGMGALSLKDTAGGAKAKGTAKLTLVTLAKQLGGADLKLTAVGTVAKVAAYNISKKTVGAVKMGATITWGGTQPLGTFTEELTLTVAY